MFANRYTALIDACSLAGVLRRNLLLSFAEAEFFRPAWSDQILDETKVAIARILAKKGEAPAIAEQLASKHVNAIRRAFPEAEVTEFEKLLEAGADLTDRDDAHVLAAAIKAQAATIVTENLDDFSVEILQRYNLEARSADEFIADTISLDEAKAVEVVKTMRTRFQRPTVTSDELLRRMDAQGLLQTVDILRPHARSL